MREAPAGLSRGARFGLALSLALTAPLWGLPLHPHVNVWALFDGPTHLLRAHYVRELIAAGEWYALWFPQQYGGYGYPTLAFYAPATYYALLALAALPLVGIHQAFQALAALGSAALVAGCYALGWRLWRHAPAAALGAALTAYAPFVLPDNVFRAGALPRVLALALVPWLLWACLSAASDDRAAARKGWWLTAGLTAALLLTHNVTSFFAAGLASVLLAGHALARRSGRGALRASGAAGLGAAASAFFWLAALVETPLVQTERLHAGNLHYRNHFLAWPGFHPPLWGEPARSVWTPGWPIDLHLLFPYSSAGPPKLALWQALMVAGAAALLAIGWARRGHTRSGGWWVGTLGAALAAVTYAQQFDWALPLWERHALLRAVQLPSRLLALTGLGVALAGAGALALWTRPTSRRAWRAVSALTAACAVSTLAGLPLPFDPGRHTSVSVTQAIAEEHRQPGTTVSTHEFLPRTATYREHHEGEARGFWLYERLFPEASWLAGRVMVWHGAAAIGAVEGGPLATRVQLTAGPEGAALAFHQLAFSGWRAWIDGVEVPVGIVPAVEASAIEPGFIEVEVPPGEHVVALAFGRAPIRLAAALLSVLTLALAGAWLLARGSFVSYRAAGAALALVALLAGARLANEQLAPLGAVRPLATPLAAAVSQGRAQISSPTGAALGPDRFVDLRQLSLVAADRPLRDVGGRARRWLYMHPPSEVAHSFVVPSDAFLQTGLAVSAWDTPTGDGVEFRATLTPAGGTPATIVAETLNPRARGEQRRWVDVVVDLRPWAGQQVTLTLRTEGRQDPTYDCAGWGEPAIVLLDPLTADRLLRSAAEQHRLLLRP